MIVLIALASALLICFARQDDIFRLLLDDLALFKWKVHLLVLSRYQYRILGRGRDGGGEGVVNIDTS